MTAIPRPRAAAGPDRSHRLAADPEQLTAVGPVDARTRIFTEGRLACAVLAEGACARLSGGGARTDPFARAWARIKPRGLSLSPKDDLTIRGIAAGWAGVPASSTDRTSSCACGRNAECYVERFNSSCSVLSAFRRVKTSRSPRN